MLYGYHGKILEIDLSEQKTETSKIDEKEAALFIGGATLGASRLLRYLKAIGEPDDPQNPLMFITGPLTGSKIPMVSRASVCGISPQTGIWGESTTGGRFPAALKGTGFDGLVITGKAEKPVYLVVTEQGAEIKDASHLWGKDIYETQAAIRKEVQGKAVVACIGKGGENRVAYACIMNDEGRAAGRCGLGALMGAKNLKAVVVSGDKNAPLASPGRLDKLVSEARDAVNNFLNKNAFALYGTNFYMDLGMRIGDVPAKYYQKSVFPASKVHGPAFRTRYTMGRYACKGCLIGCGRVIKGYGPDKTRVDGPEYETVAAFGPLCMNFDPDSIVEANHLCNLHGIDTISAGVSIAFAMHLFEKGIIDKEKTGIEIRFGDSRAIVRLVEMIINQEGFGEILAQGTKRMAEILGVDPGQAANVKGLEIPMHDPRAYQGAALAYGGGPRGPCHLKGSFYNYDVPGIESAAEVGITFTDKNDPSRKGAFTAKTLSFCEIFNALLLCQFSPIPASLIAKILSAITGRTWKATDLLVFGERSFQLKRAVNCLRGITAKDDNLPEIASKPLTEGATAGIRPDLETMKNEFYEVMDWDNETGRPSRRRLESLGLKQAADMLYG